jgi:hypothetical protein
VIPTEDGNKVTVNDTWSPKRNKYRTEGKFDVKLDEEEELEENAFITDKWTNFFDVRLIKM